MDNFLDPTSTISLEISSETYEWAERLAHEFPSATAEDILEFCLEGWINQSLEHYQIVSWALAYMNMILLGHKLFHKEARESAFHSHGVYPTAEEKKEAKNEN